MNANYPYLIVLTAVLAAWFCDMGGKNWKSAECGAKQSKAASQVVNDIAALGMSIKSWMPGGVCNIEYINNQLSTNGVQIIKKGEGMSVVGWIINSDKKSLPDSVILHLHGQRSDYYVPVKPQLSRPDVRDYYQLPGRMIDSGFRIDVSLKDIQPNGYALTLMTTNNNSGHVCDNGRKIIIE